MKDLTPDDKLVGSIILQIDHLHKPDREQFVSIFNLWLNIDSGHSVGYSCLMTKKPIASFLLVSLLFAEVSQSPALAEDLVEAAAPVIENAVLDQQAPAAESWLAFQQVLTQAEQAAEVEVTPELLPPPVVEEERRLEFVVEDPAVVKAREAEIKKYEDLLKKLEQDIKESPEKTDFEKLMKIRQIQQSFEQIRFPINEKSRELARQVFTIGVKKAGELMGGIQDFNYQLTEKEQTQARWSDLHRNLLSFFPDAWKVAAELAQASGPKEAATIYKAAWDARKTARDHIWGKNQANNYGYLLVQMNYDLEIAVLNALSNKQDVTVEELLAVAENARGRLNDVAAINLERFSSLDDNYSQLMGMLEAAGNQKFFADSAENRAGLTERLVSLAVESSLLVLKERPNFARLTKLTEQLSKLISGIRFKGKDQGLLDLFQKELPTAAAAIDTEDDLKTYWSLLEGYYRSYIELGRSILAAAARDPEMRSDELRDLVKTVSAKADELLMKFREKIAPVAEKLWEDRKIDAGFYADIENGMVHLFIRLTRLQNEAYMLLNNRLEEVPDLPMQESYKNALEEIKKRAEKAFELGTGSLDMTSFEQETILLHDIQEPLI